MRRSDSYYTRKPWSLDGGRQAVRVQRHKCYACNKTYSFGATCKSNP